MIVSTQMRVVSIARTDPSLWFNNNSKRQWSLLPLGLPAEVGGLAKLPLAALFLLMSVRDIANLASTTHG